MNILIIEDEQMAFVRLEKLIKELEPTAIVLAHIETVANALNWFAQNPEPDLVISDIHLADGSSFMVFDHIVPACPIVFTTAYDEYALKAFKLNSIDYLLKPIDKTELKRALDKFKNRNHEKVQQQAINTAIASLFQAQKTFKERFLVKMGDRLIPVNASESNYFVYDNGYVFLYHKDKKYPVDFSLDELEDLLDPKIFFRLNRKMIAQIGSISKITTHFNGKLKIDLVPPFTEDLYVSRERANDFKAWLEGV
jgi:two-component system, LytTR family, response regulator LytT